MRAIGGETDDDLRVLGLVADLAQDAARDLSEVEASHPHGVDEWHVDRTVIGYPLRAEVAAGSLQGWKNTAFVVFEDADSEYVAWRHRNPRTERDVAHARGHVDAGDRFVGYHGGRRQLDDVERKGFGAIALCAAHPWAVARHHLASGEAATQANG